VRTRKKKKRNESRSGYRKDAGDARYRKESWEEVSLHACAAAEGEKNTGAHQVKEGQVKMELVQNKKEGDEKRGCHDNIRPTA